MKKLNMNDPAVQHSIRFRRVANRYPLTVAYAYDGDILAAARDTDEQVAERVRQWELSQGYEPKNWIEIGWFDEGRLMDAGAEWISGFPS